MYGKKTTHKHGKKEKRKRQIQEITFSSLELFFRMMEQKILILVTRNLKLFVIDPV
jgi:hypothetical protein